MLWYQRNIRLEPRKRGFHLITGEIVAEIAEIRAIEVGLMHLFIQHTSASLALNENADPTVRSDMEAFFSKSVPENAPYFVHTYEGPDDMPAHIKAITIGSAVTIPVQNGRLALGTWQGVYLCEHRNRGGARNLVATAFGSG